MENMKDLFDKGIQETEEKIKLTLEIKNKATEDLKKLNLELRRREKARQIYFGEKSKKMKKLQKKIENKPEESL